MIVDVRLLLVPWTLVAIACAAPGSAHRRAGVAAQREGRLEEAELRLRMALAERPRDGEARAGLGLLLLRRGLPWAAWRELRAAARDGAVREELAALERRRREGGCRPDDLGTIAAEMRSNPARADRRARAHADVEIGAWCRVPAIVEAWLAAGDAGRARSWAEELVADAPGWAPGHLLLARALVAERNPRRALLALTAAEARADRRGAAAALVSHELRRAGFAVEAIGAARLGLSLAGPPERSAAFEAGIAAQLAAGRAGDAERLFADYRRELSAEQVPVAAARIRAALGVLAPPGWLTDPDAPARADLPAAPSRRTPGP
jgi:hypothetical protein